MTQAALNNAIVLYRLAITRQDVEKAHKTYFLTSEFQEILKNPTIPLAKKYDIIEQVYRFEKTPKPIIDFIKMMCKLGYAGQMEDIFDAYYKYDDRKKHIIRVNLISAAPATNEEVEDAYKLLQSKYPNDKILITQRVDETLLGGYVIETLNTEYDRSYEGRIRQLERKLIRR